MAFTCNVCIAVVELRMECSSNKLAKEGKKVSQVKKLALGKLFQQMKNVISNQYTITLYTLYTNNID
jgi:hypothetical protein